MYVMNIFVSYCQQILKKLCSVDHLLKGATERLKVVLGKLSIILYMNNFVLQETNVINI